MALQVRGVAGWLLSKLQGDPKEHRLTVVERISLAPRQSLVLVEVEGRRFLVATSQDGTPSIFPLDAEAGSGRLRHSPGGHKAWRIQ